MIMCGDSAGLIHPLCGNGMAMAIHAAKLVAEVIDKHKASPSARNTIEQAYRQQWQTHFSKRLWMGRQLQRLLLNRKMANVTMNTVARSETFLRYMIRSTHGNPILVS